MVKKMLGYSEVQAGLHDIHATFLEPSAGEGAFLTEILRQKLDYVNSLYSGHRTNWKYDLLWALCSIYGIEYLQDNIDIARKNMMEVFKDNFRREAAERAESTNLFQSAEYIIEKNIVQGNFLTRKNNHNEWIKFSEWKRVDGYFYRVQRIESTFDSMFPDGETSGERLYTVNDLQYAWRGCNE